RRLLSALFPYTTLFRSRRGSGCAWHRHHPRAGALLFWRKARRLDGGRPLVGIGLLDGGELRGRRSGRAETEGQHLAFHLRRRERSEEDTSELQSRVELV